MAETFFQNLVNLSTPDLLAAHSSVLNELRRRGVIRSSNNPTGDYAEWLVSSRLKLSLADKSVKGYDAIDENGVRYQIKARRTSPDNSSTQLGVIRNLEGNDFDVLIAVVFDNEWNVSMAASMTHEAVGRVALFRKHVNGHVMHLRKSTLSVAGVRDITSDLSAEERLERAPCAKVLNVFADASQRTSGMLSWDFAFDANGVDDTRRLLYLWEIHDASTGVLLASYVGKAENGIARRRREYSSNVSRLLGGLPYRKGNPDGFRSIHRALADAVRLNHRITLRLLRNVPREEDIYKAEREMIVVLGCLLNG
ncbi:MAG TPA: hypothetical protein VJU59_23180 [Paraburkholderia sp.]|uniref:hypothetical protein n=1 Tax=Paraburkholderia sp. TaxID=1926495 RepID=UPI002B493352|nr:hypothetical protein [Paraburkholderia sp.]HKR42537.1 hypothetical protein [Paraburkholderia sp.]